METPFIKGLNCKATFQLAQPNATTQNFVLQKTTIDIEPDVTEIADDIIGNKRSSLDRVLNYYTVSMSLQIRDLRLLRGFLAFQREQDLTANMAASGLGVLISPNDGTRQGFSLVGYVLGGWKLNISGRSDRVKLVVPGRCEDMVDLPSL